jgi:ribosomal protein S18 acetylase RimI-like enzyme
VTATQDLAIAGSPIDLPDAPHVPGLRFRHYAGPGDHPAMVRVSNAAWEADGESRVETVAEIDVAYANLVNCDPYRDVVIAEVDGELAGYSRVSWENQNWGGRSYDSWGAVDPAWRRRGIGGALLRQNERQLRAIGAEHDYDGPRWLTSWSPDGDVGHHVLMEREGYLPVRHFFLMLRPSLDDIPDTPVPEGLEVRPVEPTQLRELFDADVEAFRDHFGGVDSSDATFRSWADRPTFDPSIFLVAWDGDEIAGGVINGIYPEENERLGVRRGFLDSVFTRRAWRRRGLAGALICRSLVVLRERGMTSAGLGVDASNPSKALKLYRTFGFEERERSTAFRKPWDPSRGPEWEALDQRAEQD